MPKTEMIFDLADIDTITIDCPKCQNTLFFRGKTGREYESVAQCGCGWGADTIPALVGRYRDFFDYLRNVGVTVQFRVSPQQFLAHGTGR